MSHHFRMNLNWGFQPALPTWATGELVDGWCSLQLHWSTFTRQSQACSRPVRQAYSSVIAVGHDWSVRVVFGAITHARSITPTLYARQLQDQRPGSKILALNATAMDSDGGVQTLISSWRTSSKLSTCTAVHRSLKLTVRILVLLMSDRTKRLISRHFGMASLASEAHGAARFCIRRMATHG